ncbi:hypothetical protein Ait01nite_006880 [Actinoplanes italicus]|uniref:Uncharacterized protein n=1 Tax=Actinoplanes italicus TaxID=113567 RepID=A0A2T0KLX1_9ACTN|nr:hypothetical protein [Actinoplanes italicus]PRX24628.1 hypothetical protein CLV67_102405 [Actinoplanes italicus]GIE27643.1 hypothetical protein Ait01nite_006880 [Actinoplanes italicus]
MNGVLHRKWLLAGLIVVVLVAGVVLVLRSSQAPTSGTSSCRLATPGSAEPVGGTSGIEVVEQGHSRVVGETPWVSMGAVLRNTTGRVAYRTEVTLDALGADGRAVIWADHEVAETQVVPVIPPGGSVAVGNSLALSEEFQDGRISVRVTIRIGQWLDAGDGADGLGGVKATLVAGSGKRSSDGLGSVAYLAESPHCAAMTSRGVAMVFRSDTGKIVGGTLNNGPELYVCEPGRHEVTSANTGQPGVPADADLDRTAITVYCDFDRPRHPPVSGAPYN